MQYASQQIIHDVTMTFKSHFWKINFWTDTNKLAKVNKFSIFTFRNSGPIRTKRFLDVSVEGLCQVLLEALRFDLGRLGEHNSDPVIQKLVISINNNNQNNHTSFHTIMYFHIYLRIKMVRKVSFNFRFQRTKRWKP